MNAPKHPYEPFKHTPDAARFDYERRDCSVRALAIASGMTYAAAHKRCKDGGRRDGRGFNNLKYARVLHACGFQHVPGLTGRTLDPTRADLQQGRYVIYLRGHFMAVVHGTHMEMLNCRESINRRIKWAYRLTDPTGYAQVA